MVALDVHAFEIKMPAYDYPAFWLPYYRHQAIQSGHGIDGFHGLPYQRGNGLGSFFRSLFRVAVPVLKQAAKTTAARVGQQALSAVGNITADVTGGKNLKQAIMERGKQAAANVLHQTADSFQSGSGLGFQASSVRVKLPKRTGIKRKHKSKNAIAKKRRRLVKSDIFGPLV